jgi:hypothetical protein
MLAEAVSCTVKRNGTLLAKKQACLYVTETQSAGTNYADFITDRTGQIMLAS